MYSDRFAVTKMTIFINKPGIVTLDVAVFVDVTISHDEGLAKAENEKRLKDLTHGTSGM